MREAMREAFEIDPASWGEFEPGWTARESFRARELRGFRVSDVAKRAGVDEGTVRRYLRGRAVRVRIDTALRELGLEHVIAGGTT
ncbi:MAG: helix-turn-helix transcriptional regulator [Deltaproteobacteria bacterium]|nr:helix-turn-helix transcriptional regulator [Deltaproteobacteria bacterium]